MVESYYMSWAQQETALRLPVATAEVDEFVLEDGRRIYDFISTSFQASFGHSHPRIRERIQLQLGRMPIASPKAVFSLKEQVSQSLLAHLRLEGGKIFYTVSGAESVENALKIARQVSGRHLILSRWKSYHGATLGALSVTGDWRQDAHWTYDEGTVRIPEPYDDPNFSETEKIIQQAGPDRIAALIVETISGTNGVVIPPASWWHAAQQSCQHHGILLIADEVLSGFGRTGRDFAFHHFELQPDLVCMSKAITGGYIPFGAVWTNPRIAAYYQDQVLSCGLTNYAHPLGLAAMQAVLETLDDPAFQENRQSLERLFADQLQQVQTTVPTNQIRCRGLLAAIELADASKLSWQALVDQGLYLYCKDNLIVLAPPLISKPARLQSAMTTLIQYLGDR